MNHSLCGSIEGRPANAPHSKIRSFAEAFERPRTARRLIPRKGMSFRHYIYVSEIGASMSFLGRGMRSFVTTTGHAGHKPFLIGLLFLACLIVKQAFADDACHFCFPRSTVDQIVVGAQIDLGSRTRQVGRCLRTGGRPVLAAMTADPKHQRIAGRSDRRVNAK